MKIKRYIDLWVQFPNLMRPSRSKKLELLFYNIIIALYGVTRPKPPTVDTSKLLLCVTAKTPDGITKVVLPYSNRATSRVESKLDNEVIDEYVSISQDECDDAIASYVKIKNCKPH